MSHMTEGMKWGEYKPKYHCTAPCRWYNCDKCDGNVGPSKCAYSKPIEPVCQYCGHEVSEHGFMAGCIYVTSIDEGYNSYCNCSKNKSDLQPKECDHEWGLSDDEEIFTCASCGKQLTRAEFMKDADPIRPDSRKVIEKHCTRVGGCFTAGIPALIPSDERCQSCTFWQPVEPAEKRYIVGLVERYTLEKAKAVARGLSDKLTPVCWVAEIVGEMRYTEPEPTVEWHEEQ
jgi:hypothetical protein